MAEGILQWMSIEDMKDAVCVLKENDGNSQPHPLEKEYKGKMMRLIGYEMFSLYEMVREIYFNMEFDEKMSDEMSFHLAMH